jgi:hypothetical protein
VIIYDGCFGEETRIKLAVVAANICCGCKYMLWYENVMRWTISSANICFVLRYIMLFYEVYIRRIIVLIALIK